MMNGISDWDSHFEKQFQNIPFNQRDKAGIILPLIPSHADWDDFLKQISHEWEDWRKNLLKYQYL